VNNWSFYLWINSTHGQSKFQKWPRWKSEEWKRKLTDRWPSAIYYIIQVFIDSGVIRSSRWLPNGSSLNRRRIKCL